MLVLARKTAESIVIGDDITITVIQIRGDAVRIGISAPLDIPVNREEIQDILDHEREQRRLEGNA